MSASELLLRAARAGVAFWLEDGRLAYRAPRDAMTEELRAEIIDHKAELIAALSTAQPALPAVSRHEQQDGAIPLTSGQQRLWLIDRRLGPSPLYNIHFRLRWRGELDGAALALAFRDTIARHAALRMTFSESDGTAVAAISPDDATELVRFDLRGSLSPADAGVGAGQSNAADEFIEAHQRAPFDLKQGPLTRTAVVTLADDEHVVLVTQHHIVTDGWSLRIFLADLSRCYLARHQHRPAPPARATYSYADFARWELRRRETKPYQENQRWWAGHLAGLPPLVLGETQHAADHTGAVTEFCVPAELAGRLRNLAQIEGCTLYTVLLTAWAILLFRYTRQPDFAIGTVTSGRDRAEFQDVVGFFANTVVFRCDLSGNPSVRDAIARVRAETTAVFEREIPFADVVMAAGAVPDQGLTPLIQAAFMFPNFGTAEFGDAGSAEAAGTAAKVTVEARIDGSVEGTTKFDLMLTMQEEAAGEQGLSGCLEYATARFGAAAAKRMTEHFLVLLESMSEDQARTISKLKMLSQQERQQLLVEWNTR